MVKIPMAFVLHSLCECARRDSIRLKYMKKSGMGQQGQYIEQAIIRKAERLLAVLTVSRSMK